jgi:hypothetical protein
MADFVIAEAALGALEAKHAASSFWTTPIESSVRVGEASRTFLPLNAMTALRSGGHEVRAFTDPMSALGALDEAKRVEVLITRGFPPGQPNGVAIARTARLKRPGVKILRGSARDAGAYRWLRRVSSGSCQSC